jgi:hypothetical protein
MKKLSEDTIVGLIFGIIGIIYIVLLVEFILK